MKPITRGEKIMREFWCTVCGAMPGVPCHTKSGVDLRDSHSARFYAATEAGRLPIPS